MRPTLRKTKNKGISNTNMHPATPAPAKKCGTACEKSACGPRGRDLQSSPEMHEYARPLSHLELMERLGGAAFDRATVYRILSDLTEASLLRRMDLGDKVWRYELLDRCRPIADDHAHFLCTECNKVTCLPPLALSPVGGGSLPPELAGAEIHLRVTGRCGLCAAG